MAEARDLGGTRVARLDWPVDDAARAEALDTLEGGGVVMFPRRAFEIRPEERFLLDPAVSNGKQKNVSLDPRNGKVSGSSLDGEKQALLESMIRRYANWAADTVRDLLPRYADALETKRTSFRPCAVAGRVQSPRKDDRRLHADAFPSQPVQGRRILRVFANVNPEGQPRIWEVGESFTDYAARFLPRVPPQAPGAGWAMERLRITKGRRTPYDHVMLHLHDMAKTTQSYLDDAPRTRLEIPAGATWMVFTDGTVHAALSGQHALEQTFLLPAQAMKDEARSPLRILERMTERALV